MMNEFYMEMEVGEASPLSFFSFSSSSPGFLPALLALAVNFEGEAYLPVLLGDWPGSFDGDMPWFWPTIVIFFLRPGDSVS